VLVILIAQVGAELDVAAITSPLAVALAAGRSGVVTGHALTLARAVERTVFCFPIHVSQSRDCRSYWCMRI